MSAQKLIFDFGMHDGNDTAYYLARGFRVIALEANPLLSKKAGSRFRRNISQDQLTIENRALWRNADETITFYLSEANDEWSSLDRWRAESGGKGVREASVETTTLNRLIEQYGVPHYIKCDIEGADEIFVDQLIHTPKKPDFISVEGISIDWMAKLRASGYDKFQLVNQAKVRRFAGLEKLAGVYGESEFRFTGSSSGRFGFDLSKEHWMSFQEAASLWLKYLEIKTADEDMVLDNWFDYHATTTEVLERETDWPW